jgi:hypothetical protein
MRIPHAKIAKIAKKEINIGFLDRDLQQKELGLRNKMCRVPHAEIAEIAEMNFNKWVKKSGDIKEN